MQFTIIMKWWLCPGIVKCLLCTCATIQVRRSLCNNCSPHVSRNSVSTSPIESRSSLLRSRTMSPCARPGPLFPGIPPRITVSQCRRLHSLLIESLRVLIRLNFTRCCLRTRSQEEICIIGLLERKKEPTWKLHVCTSLQHRRSLHDSTIQVPSGVRVIICIMMKFSSAASHRFRLLTEKGARRRPATALSPAATEFGVGQTKS